MSIQNQKETLSTMPGLPVRHHGFRNLLIVFLTGLVLLVSYTEKQQTLQAGAFPTIQRKTDYSQDSQYLQLLPFIRTSAPPASVQFFAEAAADFDAFTLGPPPQAEVQQWFHDHYWRMIGFSPYYDNAVEWSPATWVYKGLYGIYRCHSDWDTDWRTYPDDWFLKDVSGNRLFNKFECPNSPWCQDGGCAMFAADVGNPGFQMHWIQQADLLMQKGYRGLWIDYVNMTLEQISDSNGNAATPLDPRTGQLMTTSAWRHYMATFLEEIRYAFPEKEIAHNILWWYGTPYTDTSILRQIQASDYINLERGINDAGLQNGTLFEEFLAFNDAVHIADTSILFMIKDAPDVEKIVSGAEEREYNLAGWLLIWSEGDAFFSFISNKPPFPPMQETDYWWKGYGLNLGAPEGERYIWNSVYRRDFQCGIVLVNRPGQLPVSLDLETELSTLDGENITVVELEHAAILLKTCALLGG